MGTMLFKLFVVLVLLSVGIIGFKNLVREIIYVIHELRVLHKERQKRKASYVEHVCDRSVDGMCVECQLNAVRAMLAGIKPLPKEV